jgi:RNA polymerase sigma-70 factor (ECF subfamily)
MAAEPDGFAEFYEGSRQRVYEFLYALTGDRAEAQDVAHEAFVRAWQRWPTVKHYADPAAWVRTVGRNIAVSQWRRTRNRLVAHRRHGVVAESPAPNADTLDLLAALRKVSVDQRSVLALFYVCDMSITAIAAELGVAEGTVKARLSRGRAALARELALEGEQSNV